MNKTIVVCGPTATGKTGLAVLLAKRFGGEVIGADSMQVYKGLTIGTAAATEEETGGVPHHLVGFLDPSQQYSVAAWLSDAERAADGIASRGKLPILCGGTGLYISSFVNGIQYPQQQPSPKLQAQLEQQWQAHGGEYMLNQLAQHDPKRAQQLHPNDKKRVLRALVQVLDTGQTAAERDTASRSLPPKRSALCIGLKSSERQQLYQRINSRVDIMMQQGLLAEAQTVWQNSQSYKTAAQAIGYKEFFPYFSEESPLDVCIDKLKQASRNYAKRQLTWFDKLNGIHWLEAGSEQAEQQACVLAEEFLSKPE